MKRFVSMVLVFVLIVGCFAVTSYAEDGVELTDEQQAFYDAVVRDDGSVTFDEIVDVMNEDHVLGSKILDYYDSIVTPLGDVGGDVARVSVQYDVDEWGGTITYNTETGVEVYSDDSDIVERVESDAYQAEMDVDPQYTYVPRPDLHSIGKTVYKLYICVPGSSTPSHHATAFQISNNYLATSAHCLYVYKHNVQHGGNAPCDCGMTTGWVGKILCVPCPYLTGGTSGSVVRPYGSVYQVGSNMAVGANWKRDFDAYSDWGVIQTQRPIGHGWVSRRLVRPETLVDTSRSVSVYGYGAGDPILRVSTGKMQGVFDTRVYSSYGDTVGGMSGGLVVDWNGVAVGIYRGSSVDGLMHMFVGFDKYLFEKLNTYN